MVSYRFTLIAVTGLLRAGSSLQATAPAPADMKCDPKGWSARLIAITWAKIKYEPDSTLFKDSGHIERISGNCVVIVVKTLQTIVNKQTVEDGFKKMIAQCKDSARFDFSFRSLSTELRVTKQEIDEQRMMQHSMSRSYKALTTSSDGHFISASKAPTNVLVNSVKTCKVGVFTSDVSNITATKHDVDDIFGKMLDKCNGKVSHPFPPLSNLSEGRSGKLTSTYLGSGWCAYRKGAAGPNGRLFLIAIPTKKP
ncbi:hypothetical protein H4Q26_001779 [Puccinia striiformis f. sp. tritici PST-130]|nr:hypothetical protein H4Q26_001779 [Puccinia striiformis f. sp. tritici PST-130]